MALAVYLAFFILFLPPVILANPLAKPIHIPITRRHPIRRDPAREADKLRRKYGYLSRRRATQDFDMTDQQDDSSYYGTIGIGTPSQPFNVVLDSGSADLFVAIQSCDGCPSNILDTTKSNTFKGSQTTASVTYGSGSVSGDVVSDTVVMGGFTVPDQGFLGATSVSANLVDNPAAGLLGLAWQSLASTGAKPFWQALMDNNLLTSPEMSFYLEHDSSSLGPGGVFTLGGTNPSLFSGEIEFLDLLITSTPTFWQLTLSSLTVNGAAVTLSIVKASAAIDTGTTLIGGPQVDIVTFYSAIPGSTGPDANGYFFFPCDTSVEVSVSFGGRSWPISAANIIADQVPNSNKCQGSFFVLDLDATQDDSNPTWVFGDSFMKNVYSVLRYSPPSIGFAQLSTAAGGSGTVTSETVSGTFTVTSPYPGTASAAGPSTPTSAAMSTTIPAFLLFSTAFTATIVLCL